LLANYTAKSAEDNHQHAAKQAYIAFGMSLAAAAFEGVDATPMEGFNPSAVDEILGLKEKGLKSTLLLPLGYRDVEKDWLAGLVKVRKSYQDFVTEIK
jgi:nitroreductase